MCVPKNADSIIYFSKLIFIGGEVSEAKFNICQSSVHTKFNKLNHFCYKYRHGSDEPWFCFSCCTKIFPSGTPSKKDFISFAATFSLKVTIAIMIKKVYFHYSLLRIWVSCLTYSIGFPQRQTVTLKMLLNPMTMTLSKFKL